MPLIDRVRDAAHLDPDGLVPFVVAGNAVGLVHTDTAGRLAAWPEVFAVDDTALVLSPDLATAAQRSAAVATVLAALRDEGLMSGWRDELYPVFANPDDPPLLSIERAAAVLFGILTVAVNLNGYVEAAEGGLSLWLQRRSASKPISPGKLDVLVSGGLPVGADPFENLVKECAEEAGIEEALARRAQFVGTVGFRTRRPDGIHHGHYLNYDLALPPDFTPDNRDGEVEAFYLWPADRVIDVLSHSEDVAFDSALVIIDFLIRHGAIGRDDPDFDDLARGLRH